MQMAREAGFTHAKMVLHWAAVEPSPGNFIWNSTKENDFDNIMKAARAEGLALVVRVDGVPDWAGGSPANANLDAVRSFYAQAAQYGRGTAVAYEILNEPNLDREWGGAPNAAAYTAFMKAAYRGIKAGDPDALVLGGGPAPGTGNNPGATIEDVDFINGMYDAGAKGFMDALSVHNYGGNTPPEQDPSTCGICFRRAELYRDLMVRRGDADSPVWLTEWGYLVDQGQYLGGYEWMKVSAEAQADYIVRAHNYAAANWPWLKGSLLFNIDGAASPYQNYGAYDAKSAFSILNADYSPRPAFRAIQEMRGAQLAAEELARKQAEQEAEQVTEAATSEQPTDLQATTESQPAAPSGQATLRVSGTEGEGVSLRPEPSTASQRIIVIPEGALLVPMGDPRRNEGRTWRQVRTNSGHSGWVVAEYLRPV
jgi:hypothetical protein